MPLDLTAAKALVFRIVRRDNVPWILENGLHCRNSPAMDPEFVPIGNAELIQKRASRVVPCPPNGSLGDYVPFYFTPHSIMLPNIKTGWNGIQQRENAEIVILVSTLHRLLELEQPFVFTDRHAYLETASFYTDLARLDQIDWKIPRNRDFKRTADDPGKVERYQAEALAYRHLPIGTIIGLACYNNEVADTLKARLADRKLDATVVVRPGWYF